MRNSFIALLAGCASGPHYVTPQSAASTLMGSASPVVSTQEAQADWWKLYKDPVLDGLAADALHANTDIRVALAHLEKARAGLRGARSANLPQGSLDASGGYRRLPAIQTLPGASSESAIVDGGISMAYEVNLFGRVKRSIEAAKGDLGAASADVDAVRVAVVANTTRAYVDAASSAHRLAVARTQAEDAARIVRARQREGTVDFLVVIDAERTTADADAELALADARAADARIALFKALGGGWETAGDHIAAR